MNAFQSKILSEIKEEVDAFHSTDFTGHGVDHIERVLALALHLAQGQAVDLFTLHLIVLLHDVEDPKLAGSLSVKKILNRSGLSEMVAAKVVRCIDALSYTSQRKGKVQVDLEGKIAQDADRLDAIGAIGVARVFSFGAHKKRPIEETLKHFDEKLFKLESLMNTAPAKKMARERTAYLKAYYERFLQEKKLMK